MIENPRTLRITEGDVRGKASACQSFSDGFQANRVSDEFGYRFAGLADGEGCFLIQRRSGPRVTGPSYACSFVLALRLDDAPFLKRLQAELGIGRTSIAASSGSGDRKNNPVIRWACASREDCLSIVALFDRFPLWSKKQADFVIWREAVLAWTAEPARTGRRKRDWTNVARAHDALRAGRAFAGSSA